MRLAAAPIATRTRDASEAPYARQGALLTALVLGLIAGCGGSSPAKTGTGGQAGAAMGTGGRASGGSTGTAGASGTGGRAAGSGGATGTGGAVDAGAVDAGGGDAAAAAAGLGKQCVSSADCGGGLTCLLPTDKLIFGQGGPANGYCTLPCAVAGDDARCQAAGGNCFDLSVSATDPAEGYCIQTCPFGTDTSANITLKCRGRMDVGCLDIAATATTPATTACLPLCGSDADCPSPRKCDPQWNVCVDVPTAGGGLGTHCVPPGDAGAGTTCSGVCLSIGSATATVASYCSTPCVLGSPNGCNFAGVSLATGGVHGVCALPRAGAAFGDVGYCANECDTVTDCPDKTDPSPICDQTFQADIGHGICSWGAPADGGTGG